MEGFGVQGSGFRKYVGSMSSGETDEDDVVEPEVFGSAP